MVLDIMIGVILVAIGVSFVWKTKWYLDIFGSMAWADEKFGGGGSYLLYKTIGLITILIGFLWATNLWNAFLDATLGALLPSSK
jgi:hypothetical protein